jgi:quercetin dioxygenase-like cupin family protein
MAADWRRVENPASGEAFTFVETSEETGGARVVTLIEVEPGGGPRPHAHPPAETFELVDGTIELVRDGRRSRLEPGQPVTVAPGSVHAFTNPGDGPATVKVTVMPPNDFERTMRVLAGLARDGRLNGPGGRPAEPALMASLAMRSGYYEPPMPRLLWKLLNGALAPFGRHAADEALTRYDRPHPSPGERVGQLR